jgi:hypothetical protein
MVPLKVIIVGLKWELSIDLFFVVVLLGISWVYLHAIKIPVSAFATLLYAALVTGICESVHVLTHYHIEDMDTVHLEVLLPAFAIGCIARSGHGEDRHESSEQPSMLPSVKELTDLESLVEDTDPGSPGADLVKSCTGGTHDDAVEITSYNGDDTDDQGQPSKQAQKQKQPPPRSRKAPQRRASLRFEDIQVAASANLSTSISAIFMVFVGLSMPALFSDSDEDAHRRRLASGGSGGGDDGSEQMPAGELVAHVLVVSVLMIVGKMFPTFCYSKEANLRTRLALSLGMCPRGEVGAGVIVISLGFGIEGSAITIAVISLAINLILSSGFIMGVKHLARESGSRVVPLDGKEEGGEKTPVRSLTPDGPDGLSTASKETPTTVDSFIATPSSPS